MRAIIDSFDKCRLCLLCNDLFVPGDIVLYGFNCIEVHMFEWPQSSMLSFVEYINRFQNVEIVYVNDCTMTTDITDPESYVDLASHIYTKCSFVKSLNCNLFSATASFFGRTLRTYPFGNLRRVWSLNSLLSSSLQWASNNDRIFSLLYSKLARFGKRCSVGKLPVEVFRFLYKFLN